MATWVALLEDDEKTCMLFEGLDWGVTSTLHANSSWLKGKIRRKLLLL